MHAPHTRISRHVSFPARPPTTTTTTTTGHSQPRSTTASRPTAVRTSPQQRSSPSNSAPSAASRSPSRPPPRPPHLHRLPPQPPRRPRGRPTRHRHCHGYPIPAGGPEWPSLRAARCSAQHSYSLITPSPVDRGHFMAVGLISLIRSRSTCFLAQTEVELAI